MKNLWLMERISRTTGWHIGIHRGKRDYYYIVASKTGTKYYPWVGVVTFFAMLLLMLVAVIFLLGFCAVCAEYGIKYWPASVGLAALTGLSGWALWILYHAFEKRPDTYKEDYEPTEKEQADWVQWDSKSTIWTEEWNPRFSAVYSGYSCFFIIDECTNAFIFLWNYEKLLECQDKGWFFYTIKNLKNIDKENVLR